MSNWYEFKKLYSASNLDDCIFKAYVVDENTYRIITDENDLFKDIFLSIIKGTYTMSTIISDNGISKYEDIKIDNQDAIKNLQQYIDMLSKETIKQRFKLEETNIIPIISFQFKGPDFNYKQGMNPVAYNRATKLVYSILNLVSGDDMQEQFLFSKAGSLIYDIHVPENNQSNHINVVKQMLLHINSGNISSFNHITYNNIIKNLYELTKIQNLDSLNIIFAENDIIDINFNNIINVYSNMDSINKSVTGIPDGYSHKHNSFKIGKYVCKMHNPQPDDIIKIKNASANTVQIIVQGIIEFEHEYTILVTSINIDGDIISFELE